MFRAEASIGRIYHNLRPWGELQYFSFSTGHNNRFILHQTAEQSNADLDAEIANTIGFRLEDDKYNGWVINLSKNSENKANLTNSTSCNLEIRPVINNVEQAPLLTVRKEKIVSNVRIQVKNTSDSDEGSDVITKQELREILNNSTNSSIGSNSSICSKHFPIRKRISVLSENYVYNKPRVIGSPFSPFLVIQPNSQDTLILVTTDGKNYTEYNYDEFFGINTGDNFKYLGGWYNTELDKFFLLNTTTTVILISTHDFKTFTVEDSTNFQYLLNTQIFDSFFQSRYTGGSVLLGTSNGAYRQNSDGTFTKFYNGFCRITGACCTARYFVRVFNDESQARTYIGTLADGAIHMTLDDGQRWFDQVYGYPITDWTNSLQYKRFWVTTDERLFAYAVNPNDYQSWFGALRQSDSDTGSWGFLGVGLAQNKNTLYHINGVFKDMGVSYDYNNQTLRIWGSHESAPDVLYTTKVKIFGDNTAYLPDIWETNSNGVGFSIYDNYIYF